MNTKKIKLFLSLIVFIFMITLIQVSVGATENESEYPEGIPSYATRNEVELVIPANEPETIPYIWGDPEAELSNGQEYILATFATTHRNLAFETVGYVIEGNSTGNYDIALYENGGFRLSSSNSPNGIMIKVDNIPIDGASTYIFKVFNSTNARIKVKLIFYSW